MLSRFLDTQVPEIPRANAASDKSYSEAYRAFKDALELPGSYLDRLYDSTVTRHFYTADEIAELRARWRR